jgi:hypothetical protein
MVRGSESPWFAGIFAVTAPRATLDQAGIAHRYCIANDR